MSVRNVIPIQLNMDTEQIVQYTEGLVALHNHRIVKELNLSYLSSVNELVEHLELTRASFERNLLENEVVGTGVRHLNVTGDNFSRTRIYIDALDLIEYLTTYCDLTYWKKEQSNDGLVKLSKLSGEQISSEDKEYLAKALIDGRFKSIKQIETEYKRTRRIVSRLTNIIESLTFSFPGSQRQMRRLIFSPTDTVEQLESYFTNYKSYENKIVKVD